MIVDHEINILSHTPVPYWQLNADFSVDGCEWNARVGKEAGTKMTKIGPSLGIELLKMKSTRD